METEEWKVIKGFPRYAVSSEGRVLNMQRDAMLRIGTTGRGFRRVTLTNAHDKGPFSMHRLVAEYFLDDFDENYEVEHVNGDKNDNRASNLKMGVLRVRQPSIIRTREELVAA